MYGLISSLAYLLTMILLAKSLPGHEAAVILWMVGAPAVLFGTIIVMAKNDFCFTYVEESTIKCIVKGESYHLFLMRVSGHKLVGGGRNTIIVDYEGDEETEDAFEDAGGSWFGTQLLVDLFGIYYYGIPGIHKIHSWKIPADKVRASIATIDNVTDYVEHKTKTVYNLRWQFNRPVVLSSFECGIDNFKVDLVIVGEWEVIMPYQAIMVWGEDLFENLDRRITSKVRDYMADLRYIDFRTMSHDFDSELAGELCEAYGCDHVHDKQVVLDLPENGIVRKYGVKLATAGIPYFELSAGQEDEEDAASGVRVAELRAKAKEEEAKGTAKSIRLVGAAKAAAARAGVKAFRDQGASPDVATIAYMEPAKAAEVGGEKSNIATWVEGGGKGVTLNITAGNASATPEPPASNDALDSDSESDNDETPDGKKGDKS